MMDKAVVNAITQHITCLTGERFTVRGQMSTGGGCINHSFRLDGDHTRYFIKTNIASRLEMFVAEAAGLQALAKTQSIKVPKPIGTGQVGGHSYLILEYIVLSAAPMAQLGEQLACLHRHTARQYGFHLHNTIGLTPQNNAFSDDWISFWQKRRLTYQLELAEKNGADRAVCGDGYQLVDRCAEFFGDYQPVPSLLHGDLWAGNCAGDALGQPVIFDPAVYYGDRETDIAMTELFGGFGADFYTAYQQVWPLAKGYERRKHLYNLYHVLNHFNLFGGGYLAKAKNIIGFLLQK